MTDVNRRVLPGFALSLGYTLLYMSLLVAIPSQRLLEGVASLARRVLGRGVSERAVAAYSSRSARRSRRPSSTS